MTITFGTGADFNQVNAEPPTVVDISMIPEVAQLLPQGWRFNYSKSTRTIFADHGRISRHPVLTFAPDCLIPAEVIGPAMRDYLNLFIPNSNQTQNVQS